MDIGTSVMTISEVKQHTFRCLDELGLGRRKDVAYDMLSNDFYLCVDLQKSRHADMFFVNLSLGNKWLYKWDDKLDLRRTSVPSVSTLWQERFASLCMPEAVIGHRMDDESIGCVLQRFKEEYEGRIKRHFVDIVAQNFNQYDNAVVGKLARKNPNTRLHALQLGNLLHAWRRFREAGAMYANIAATETDALWGVRLAVMRYVDCEQGLPEVVPCIVTA